jgi:hypothetical protein
MGVAALICGLIGIIFGWFPIIQYFALVLAILGIVFGGLGIKNASKTGKGKGLAITGLVLGIIGTLLAGIGVFACTVCAAGAVGAVNAGADAVNAGTDVLRELQRSSSEAAKGLQQAGEAIKSLPK